MTKVPQFNVEFCLNTNKVWCGFQGHVFLILFILLSCSYWWGYRKTILCQVWRKILPDMWERACQNQHVLFRYFNSEYQKIYIECRELVVLRLKLLLQPIVCDGVTTAENKLTDRAWSEQDDVRYVLTLWVFVADLPVFPCRKVSRSSETLSHSAKWASILPGCTKGNQPVANPQAS